MGGNSDSTTQSVPGLASVISGAQPQSDAGQGFNLGNLASLFGGSQGYSQPVQTPQIAAPQYPAALTPTPQDAAAATRARMQARAPVMAAPVAAPQKQRGDLVYDGSVGVSPWRGH